MDQNMPGRKQKTNKSRRENAVQGTNDNSIISKCSMASVGYFNDPFLQHFVAKTSKRAPLINRGYYLRALTIDRVMREFLSQDPGCRKQIISLGAGFDSSYFRLKAAGLLQDTVFFEIDFPEVVKNKHDLIQNHEELFNFLEMTVNGEKKSPHIELASLDYHLLGVDLTQINTLEAALRLCGADFDTQTLILSECVMTYMTRRCSSALVKWAGETFQEAVFVMFEQMNPDDAFGLFMQNHFHTIGSPLKCITSFPTLDSQNQRFFALGWDKSRNFDLNEIYYNMVSGEEHARIEKLDPFDEYEEFNLKCAHYFILIASTSADLCDLLTDRLISVSKPLSQNLKPIPGMVTITPLAPGLQTVKRFSHASVLIKGRYVVTTGGFGEVDGRHQRLQEISVTDITTLESKLIRCSSDEVQYSRMHHSSVVLSDGQVLLFGGRQSPFFLCSQLLVLDIRLDSTQMNSKLQHGESDTLFVKKPSSGPECPPTDSLHININGSKASASTDLHTLDQTLISTGDKSCMDDSIQDGGNLQVVTCGKGCSDKNTAYSGNIQIHTNTITGRDEASHTVQVRTSNTEASHAAQVRTSNTEASHAAQVRTSNTEASHAAQVRTSNTEASHAAQVRTSNTEASHAAQVRTSNTEASHAAQVRTSNTEASHAAQVRTSSAIDRNETSHTPEVQNSIITNISDEGSNPCLEKCNVRVECSTFLIEKKECTPFEGGSLNCTVLKQAGKIPCSRWRHACTLIQVEGNQLLFLHGGRRQQAEVLADTYLLDVRTGVWTMIQCKGDNPGSRHSHSMQTWESDSFQQVILVGGMGKNQIPQASIHLMDVRNYCWQTLNITGLFLPRYSHTTHILGDRLIVIGGVNLNQHTPGVAIVNLRTGVAQEYSLPLPKPDNLLMFHRHSSVLLPDDRILVVGGGGNCFSFGTHLNHTPLIIDISKCYDTMQ